MNQKIATAINNSSVIHSVVKREKPVIILTTLEECIKSDDLFALTQWLAGQTIEFNDDDEPIHSALRIANSKEHIISLEQGNKFMQLIETQQGLIVSLNLSQWPEIIDENKGTESSMEEVFIEKSILVKKLVNEIEKKHSKHKLYVVTEYERKAQKNNAHKELKDKIAKYINTTDIGIFEFNVPKGNTEMNLNHIIAKTPKNNKLSCNHHLKDIFAAAISSDNLSMSLQILKSSLKENKIPVLLTYREIELEDELKRLLNIFLNAVSMKLHKEELSISEDLGQFLLIKFQDMKDAFKEYVQENHINQLTYQNIYELEPYFLKVKKYYCDGNYDPHEKTIPQTLAHYFFYMQFKGIYKSLSQNKGCIATDELLMVKEIFNHIFSLFNDTYLDCSDVASIKNANAYLQALIEQMQLINNLINCSTSTMKSLLSHIKENISIDEQFFFVLMSIQVQPNQEINYYESLLELINAAPIEKEAKKTDQQELIEKRNYWVMKIQKYQTQKLITQYLGKNDQKIALAVDRLFDIYEKRNSIEERYQPEFNYYQILLKCARLLRSIGKSDLAATIYMKLKHYYKVEDCLQEMSLDVDGEEKVDLYLEYALYFRRIGDSNLSWKYIQKAMEINEEYLDKVLKAKNAFFEDKGEDAEEEKKLINRIVMKELPVQQYNKEDELGSVFRAKLTELIDTISDESDQVRVYFSNGILTHDRKAISA